MDLDENNFKLKFDAGFSLDECLKENLESGLFQTLRIVCKDAKRLHINPMLLHLLFPWLSGKVKILEHDVVIIPDQQISHIQHNISTIIRSYRSSLNLKYDDVKLEDNLLNETLDKFDNGDTDMHKYENPPKIDIYSDCEENSTKDSLNSSPEPKNTTESQSTKIEHTSQLLKKKSLIKNNKIKPTENIIEGKKTRKHKYRLCTECGKSVKNLSKHSLIHKGIKPERLQCHVCEKTLCSANALKVHIESVHEGIKRFSCNMCTTSFVYEAYLKHHIQVVHEGYKPPEATCPDCGKQFKFISNMTRHRRITHRGEDVQRRHFCQLCKVVFMKVSLLHKHMREEHGVNPRKRGEVRKAPGTGLNLQFPRSEPHCLQNNV